MEHERFEKIAPAVRALLPLGGNDPAAVPVSPIAAWRWSGSPEPQVCIAGEWAPLQSVNGIAVARLVDQAVEMGRRDWQRMLVAEFCSVAAAAGAGTQGEYTIARQGVPDQRVAADAQNLVTSIWHFLIGGAGDAPDASKALADFGHLAAPTDDLTPDRIRLDLDVLERLVRRDFSYWDHAPMEWGRRLDAMRAANAPLSRAEHVENMRDAMILLGDGHTRVDSADRDLLARGVLPFQIDWIGDAPVAVMLDRHALLDPDHPFITAIGGVTIREWMRTAQRAAPRGTVAMRRNWMARELRRVGVNAARVGAPAEGLRQTVTLSSDCGNSSVERVFDLVTSDPKPLKKQVESRWLGDVGYLALRGQMTSDAAAIAEAHAAMRDFAPASGLVIDIRDNGGGSRDFLRTVGGYLVPPGKAFVTSWARLRRDPGTDPARVADVMQGRYMRPWDWAGWTPAARAAAAAFEARHVPEWPLPDDDRFGPLNLLVIERLPEHGDLHLTCPVVLLTNIRNYSASDIFASSLAALPGVVHLGTPTAGGSGFAQRSVLPGSATTVQISTMASGMIAGDLYENHGVVPQEILWPGLEQWRQDLPGDPLVRRALERIEEARRV